MYTRKDISESQLIDKIDNSPCEIWIRICYSKTFVKVTWYKFYENIQEYGFTFWDNNSVLHKNIIQIDIR